MSDRIVRVAVAQGPFLLMRAVSALAGSSARSGLPPDRFRDVLVVGDLYARGPALDRLHALSRDLSRMWPFERVVFTQDLDDAFHRGEMSFAAYVGRIGERIGLTGADEAYVCRNVQPLNEAVFSLYRTARKAVIGDGLGIVDSSAASRHFSPANPEGFLDPDEAVCLAPYEKSPGIFSRIALRRTPLEDHLAVMFDAFGLLPEIRDLCRTVREHPARRKLLCCLANLTESREAESAESEAEFYARSLAPFLAQGTCLFIKPHPREASGQSGMLAERVRAAGCAAEVLSGGSALPVELLALGADLDLVLPLISSSGVGFRLLDPVCDLAVGVPAELNARYVTAAFDAGFYSRLYLTQMEMAEGWEFSVITPQAVRERRDLPPPPIPAPGLSGDRLSAWTELAARRFAANPRACAALDRHLADPLAKPLWRAVRERAVIFRP